MPAHDLEIRMAHLEGAYEQVNHRLNSIDVHIVALHQEITALGARLDAKIDHRFTWMVGIAVTTWLTTIAAILPLYFRH